MNIRLNELKTKLQQKLYFIEQQSEEVLYKWKESAKLAAGIFMQLRHEMTHYKFEDENQEIKFYKEVVPWFYSQVIYYHRLFHMEANALTHSGIGEKKFVKRELLKIHRFLKAHHHLHLYVKLGETKLDAQYFLQRNQEPLHYSNVFFSIDHYCTEHVHTLAKIIAFEKVREHLEAKMAELEQYPVQPKGLQKGKPPLRWTGSKTDLIELVYALHSSNLFNESEITDVRQIANWMETSLHVDLGNYYRVFQGIRIRKNRTQFLDDLKENLILRMDETDEHPKN